MSKEPLTVNIFPFLKINILFFPIVAASILGKYFPEFLASYTCALLHELSHITMARFLRVGISYMEILPFGVCARLKSEIIKNPVHEIIIASCGPLSNFLLAAITKILMDICSLKDPILTYFIFCNISIGAINLIPAIPLDGGRIFRAFLTLKTGSLYSYNLTSRLSKIPITLILCISVYLLITQRFNFSLLLIGVFLLSNLCTEQKNISRHALKEMLNYESKIKNSAMNKASVITAHKSTPARKILKRLSYSSYHIIHVVDDNLNVSKTLTEGQLIKALTYKGIRITLGEI